LSHGYSIKFTLIDERNFLLYQNIFELTYSSVNRSVREKTPRTPATLRGSKTVARTSWNEKTIRLISRNFVDDACKLIGEEYRLLVRRAIKRLNLKIAAQ
jgi:hypothetical protein